MHNTLAYIRDILNQYFKNEFSISENKVVLSNLVNPDGTIAQNNDGKIVFFLLNLEEESAIKNNISRSSTHSAESFTQRKPRIHLNLKLLFCANFTGKNYVEGLRYLTSLIQFFQQNNRIETRFSGKEANSNRILFELSKLNYNDMSHVWSTIGSKLMPSALYTVRFISIDDKSIHKEIPTIQEPGKTNSD